MSRQVKSGVVWQPDKDMYVVWWIQGRVDQTRLEGSADDQLMGHTMCMQALLRRCSVLRHGS